MKRKTRITKKEVIAFREEKKNYNARKAKKNIKPGPWTEVDPGFTVKATLRPVPSLVSSISVFYGSYTDTENWYEKGWYPILFNVRSEDMFEVITKHDIKGFVAACEHSLNDAVDAEGKSLYGDVVILEILDHNALNPDPEKRFISCKAKTNKKSIKGFTAVRKNQYVLL